MRSDLPVFRDRNMAACVAIAHSSCHPQVLVPKHVRVLPPLTSRVRLILRNCDPFSSTFATGEHGTNSLALGGISGRHDEFAVDPRRHRNNGIACSSAREQDRYGHCKCTEDAVMAIMKDTIQHCLSEECEVVRAKVLDQMSQGLVALCRILVVVAIESNAAPFPITVPSQFSSIKDEDLNQVQRMLQLTSLPFHNSYDEDLQALLKILQTGNGKGIRKTLSQSELTQICNRLGSDLVQCLGPLVMCFPELPLWAKHCALLLPAKVVERVAFSLVSNPNGQL